MERSVFVLPSQPRVRSIDRVLIDDAPTLDLSGQLLGERYRVRERLGFGGAGVVFLADDILFPRRPVAIKVSRSKGDHAEQRFQDEIEVLGATHHPNLIVPLDWGRTPSGHLYLVMEYLRGQSLRARLELGPVTLREVVLLGTEVGAALLAVHAAGVLHRDVKPSNIIILASTSTFCIKLIDLGVAKKAPELWPSDGTPRFETATNAAPGTPPYLPPEAGRVPPDPKFDVYGLGATLFEAATGRQYTTGAALGVLPAGLREVLAAALAPDADARPTLAAMVADLVRLRDADVGRLLQGRYELLCPLGRGAKAEVWRAGQRFTGRDVVVKRLHARATEDDAIRLHHEGQILTALDHPAFPILLDAFEAEGRLHLVMTLARGDQALTFTKDPLSPAQVCAVGIELLRGLLALHRLGVLHRDLHAGNVMIDFEGPRGRPVVTILDLGMCELLPAWWARHARYATPPERRVQLGSANQETLAWSAPETASSGWTEKSDVWSAAVLLCRLLTGHLPFAPRDKTALTCPRQHRPDCPRDLALALLAALDPDPSKRLGADQLLTRLQDAQAVLDEEALEELGEAPAQPEILRPATAPVAVDAPPAPSTPVELAPAAPASHVSATLAGGVIDGDAVEPQRRRRTRRAWQIAIVGAIVALAWWGGRVTAPATPSAERRVAKAPETPRARELPTDLAQAVPAAHTELMPMAVAIEAASPSLRRCAQTAGETLVISFTAAGVRDHFEAVAVLGGHDEAVERCVREAGAAIRFAPGAARSILKEYAP